MVVVQGEATSAARWIAGSGWQAAPVAGETTAGWTSVSCTSASFCLAASSYGNVARWTGSIWRRVFNPQQVGDYWASVSCVSPSFCMVVGRREAHLLPGAAEWNGTSLVREPTVLATGANVQQMDSVSCVSATDCTAVGYDGPSYDNVTSWVQRWDGTQWAIEPSIHSGSTEQLHGVACVASTCLAVGDRVDGVRLPFAERGV